ncbi:MAG: hypothetical protein ACFCVK_02480 [Acidimicrobiales bacterium]
MTDPADPVLETRARVASLVSKGLRIGYGLFGLAIVLFLVALVGGFTGLLTGAITFCLLVGSAILAPSIVFNYAVKAANRADRDGTW